MPRTGSLTASGRDALATCLVHIDPLTDQIDDLLEDLQIKMNKNLVFGGLVSARRGGITQVADEPLGGGMSGVMFSEAVAIECRLTQGVELVGPEHQITAIRGQFIDELDNQPALDVLLQDLGLAPDESNEDCMDEAAEMLAKRFSHGLFVGLTDRALADTLEKVRFSSVRTEAHQLKVRPVVGMDPGNKSLAVAESFHVGDRLNFCTRDENSARVDLTRMCAELRDDLDAPAPRINNLQAAGFTGLSSKKQPRGAVYIACNGRGSALFGRQGAEMQLLREQLGDIPLIGFFANGEVFAGALYGYTGVLLLFF
ncbi:MAG: hypothetical protein HC848_07895 [Limnobacter sp.]|nr:hypothetical protein [Limnobacter sp.]